jgi:hypothetical protein
MLKFYEEHLYAAQLEESRCVVANDYLGCSRTVELAFLAVLRPFARLALVYFTPTCFLVTISIAF